MFILKPFIRIFGIIALMITVTLITIFTVFYAFFTFILFGAKRGGDTFDNMMRNSDVFVNFFIRWVKC